MYVKMSVSNPSTCGCKNGKYLASIMDNLSIIQLHNKETKTMITDFNGKRATCKM